MIYSLDTNTCIRIINGRSPEARARMLATPASEIVVCSIVRAELWYGSQKSQTPERTREKQDMFLNPFASAGFDDTTAAVYARIRAHLEKQGTPIGALDMLIAAIAVANEHVLVTNNTREFQRVPDLQIEDWQT